MTAVKTGEPITGGGIRSVHFFNGRLLTGEDLSREQDANLAARLRLGRALGSGVAHGLEVTRSLESTATRPVLKVAPGVAVNRDGRALALESSVDVSLTRDRLDGTGSDLVFQDCTPLQPGTYTRGAGVYLFTIGASETREGRARVSGLGNEDAACNTAYSVEGVQFRLIRLVVPTEFLDEPDKLENRVAHHLLGTADPRRLAVYGTPFGPVSTEYGFLDDLDSSGCLDGQVPLAVLAWTSADGIRFLDRWGGRRRLHGPSTPQRWWPLVSERRLAEAESAFLQFEEHVEDLFANVQLGTVKAEDRFDFLPSVGVVPIRGSGSTSGFDVDLFLGDQASKDLATTDANLLRPLLQESLRHEAIVVGGGERIQRYLIWENELALESGATNRRVLVFAKHTLPYIGVARFGRARFGRSRFARSVI